MTRASRLAVLVVTVGLVLAAAIPWPASAGAPKQPTACKVLARAEIREVVGTSVQRSKRRQHTPKSASICNWDVGGRDSGAIVSVWVQRGRPARQGFDVSERVFGIGSEPLPQLGRLAFYSPDAGAAYVLDGSTLLYVQRLDETGDTDATALRDQAVALTELAVERL